jgi:acyl-CoA synthetase (AMP-forming)/AMP-acid ligase II
MYGTPTMFVDLLAEVKKNNNLNIETLDMCVGAGAPFSKQLIEEIMHTFKLRRFCVSSIFLCVNYCNTHFPQFLGLFCASWIFTKKSTSGVLRLYFLAYY